MTTNELKVLEVIWNWGGVASVDIIAREVRVSIDYAKLFCQSLMREGYIDFLRSKLCKIKSKGKVAVVSKKGQNSQKIIIPERPSRFGLGKDKRGRLLVGY